MTAGIVLAGASSDRTIDWNSIDWKKVNRNVRRLQARIVKAVEEGRWGKATLAPRCTSAAQCSAGEALQRLLTHSFSGKASAVRRVTENQGKNTPGVDGEIWNTPKKKAQGIASLRQHGYRAQPLRRIYIPKSDGRQRPLGIPRMLDRAMGALYKLALDPIAETTGDPNSYGFRRGRSRADAIEQCFICLARKTSATAILEADIQSCFDNISGKWLLENIPTERRILEQWLRAGYIDQGIFHHTEDGTPQGSIISPTLMNMALDGLETAIKEQLGPTVMRRAKVHIVRFADDFIATGTSKEFLAEYVQPIVEQFLETRGLNLSKKKTRLTDIEDGFDFLGQNIRKYKGKLLIKPSKKSIKEFLTKVRKIIRNNRGASAGNLIAQLNPVIRGWVNYHRHVVSKRAFSKVDHEIFEAIWRWAKRRHPNKSAKWRRAKYFDSYQGNKWVFYGWIKKRKGKRELIRLVRAVKTTIKRHVKIKSAANPYDPEWELYFERRLAAKMAENLKRNESLLRLWQSQQGRCPICEELITTQSGWESHHITALVYGGSDTMENLVLLHPTCHRQVHSLGLSVLEPRPDEGR